MTGGVFETLGGKDGESPDFSYEEALRKSSTPLIGFAAQGSHKYDLDDHAWISSHWKSSSQRRKADMGDPMAVDADMTDVIVANAESILASLGSDGKASPTTAPTDDLLIEVVIDMTDIDIDALERQPEMAFGNLVKKRAE